MLGHCLLGILLHAVVDSGIDAQAVLVEIVFLSARFLILVEPSEEFIIAPAQGIGSIVFGILVVAAFGLLRVHVTAEHIPEIRRESGVVVPNLIHQIDRSLLDGIRICLRDVLVLGHPPYHEVPEGVALRTGQVVLVPHAPEDQVAALEGLVRVDGGVVPRGLVHHAHEGGGLLYRKFGGEFVEKGL